MNFQIIAIRLQQYVPSETLGNGRGLVKRRPGLLIRHFEEQEKRQLLDVIAVGQAVIAQDIAIVPELLDELLGVAHVSLAEIGGRFRFRRRGFRS